MPTKKKWLEQFMRFGFISKGVVYSISSILTAMAAFNLGGQTAGKGEALSFLQDKPFGKVLLIVVALGLLGYVVWRLVEVFADPYNKGNDLKGLGKKAGWLISAATYLGLALYAGKMALALGSSSGGGSNSMINKLMNMEWGSWLILIGALILAGRGIFDIYYGIKQGFTKHIKEGEMSKGEEKSYKFIGSAGYISRGITIGIVAYLFIRAALYKSSTDNAETDGAFQFMQQQWGAPVVGIIALGLLMYGIFQFFSAKYRHLGEAE